MNLEPVGVEIIVHYGDPEEYKSSNKHTRTFVQRRAYDTLSNFEHRVSVRLQKVMKETIPDGN